MAMLILKSTNPDFSYIIEKNPESGLMTKSIRKGSSFGWYGCSDTYVIYFKDADNQISYNKGEEHFEYMNISRYNSPLFVLNALSSYFNSILRSKHELDVCGYEHEILIPMMGIGNVNRVSKLLNYIEGIELEFKHESGDSYEVLIKTDRSIYELIHYVSLLGLFSSIISKNYIDITMELVKKYINSMNVLNVPYYLRYIFNTNVLINKKMFKEVKPLLEMTDKYNLELLYGNTGEVRRDFVRDNLSFNNSILDLGCGEGYYTFPFSKLVGVNNVYAVDIDEEIIDSIVGKSSSRGIENIWTFNELDVFKSTMDQKELVDVLLVEVLEHMSLIEAEALLLDVLNNINFNKIIITTPNSDFNVYYNLDGMRHLDHKWEIGDVEFVSFIAKALDKSEEQVFNYEFFQIGDKVDGISPTQGVVIERITKLESERDCKNES